MKKIFLILALLVLGMANTANAGYYQAQYRGTIGGMAVEVAFGCNTGDEDSHHVPYFIGGSFYRYMKHPNQSLELREKSPLTSKTLIFEEYDGNRHTGHWVLKQTKNGFTGTLTVLKTGKKYPIKLHYVTTGSEWEWGY